jgi:hypothetical protein
MFHQYFLTKEPCGFYAQLAGAQTQKVVVVTFSGRVNNMILQFTLMFVILLSYNINTDKWTDFPSNATILLVQYSQHVLGHLQHRHQAVK